MAQQSLPNLLGVHALVWVGDTSPASVDYAVAKTKETTLTDHEQSPTGTSVASPLTAA